MFLVVNRCGREKSCVVDSIPLAKILLLAQAIRASVGSVCAPFLPTADIIFVRSIMADVPAKHQLRTAALTP
jgi:hypothetical protein